MAGSIGGLSVKNRVWVGSSELTMTLEGIKACVDAGAGAVIAKSINESQAAQDQLDIADYVFVDSAHQALGDRRPSETDSLFNRSGLAQTTLDDWLELLDEAQRYAAARACTTIDSTTVAEAAAARITSRLAEVVPAIEINVGAPHGRESRGAVRQLTEGEAVADMMSTVRTATDKPIFLKLPSTASDVQALALAGQASGARNAEDVIRFLVSGASAVELVTAVWMQGPRVITTILEGIKAYLAKHGITDTQELVGRLALKSRSYAEIEPLSHRPAPWQHGTD